MPIQGRGLEIHIVRNGTQSGMVGRSPRTRTVGTYQVFHNGEAISALRGGIFEQKGPGDNSRSGNKFDRRVEPGRYPLWTQNGSKYKTLGYAKTAAAARNFSIKPRPGIELRETGERTEILIHPAQGFLSSEGCIHPSREIRSGRGRIDYGDSRMRVIAIIDDMRTFLGGRFPSQDGQRIPDAWAVIDDDF